MTSQKKKLFHFQSITSATLHGGDSWALLGLMSGKGTMVPYAS